MNRYLLLTFALLGFIRSFGQSKNIDRINEAVAIFCKCANDAKDKKKFELCGKTIDSLSSLVLSKTDSIYILQRLKSQCSKAFDKHWGRPYTSGSKTIYCTFLQEDDLKEFHLEKFSEEKNVIKWKSNSANPIIKDIFDHRDIYDSDTLAKMKLEAQKKATLSSNYGKRVLKSETFQLLEIFSFRITRELIFYQIYARKGRLICHLTISITDDSTEIIDNLTNILTERVKHNCGE